MVYWWWHSRNRTNLTERHIPTSVIFISQLCCVDRWNKIIQKSCMASLREHKDKEYGKTTVNYRNKTTHFSVVFRYLLCHFLACGHPSYTHIHRYTIWPNYYYWHHLFMHTHTHTIEYTFKFAHITQVVIIYHTTMSYTLQHNYTSINYTCYIIYQVWYHKHICSQRIYK